VAAGNRGEDANMPGNSNYSVPRRPVADDRWGVARRRRQRAALRRRASRPVLGFILASISAILPAIVSGASHAPLKAKHGMVVSEHRIASEVGLAVLREGGNAVDAAVATGYALAVTLPTAGNLGGGGFMVVRMADGRVSAINFREKAPGAAHERMFLDEQGVFVPSRNQEGYLSTGVPGTVAGFFLAHEKFGRRSMTQLIAPAIALAEEGFAVTQKLHEDLVRYRDGFRKFPGTAAALLKNGRDVFQPGELWQQPDLARSLRRIQRDGRDGFYRGETARLLATAMRENGGLITEQDLAAYEAQDLPPVHGTYRGFDLYTMCPPSSGGPALVQMLNILEGFDLRAAGHHSARHLHLMAEAMRRAYADRARHLGDPDFNPDMPIARLVSKEHASRLRRSISLDRASVSDPVAFNDHLESPETTHYSVIDAEGNAVVVTYTIQRSYGSRVVAPGTGFLLSNIMHDFNPQPGRTDATGMIGTAPNLVAPNKRMISSMTPTIVVKEGQPYLLIGSPGGRTIINTVLQVILNVIDFQMDVSEAIAAPRVHHQWLPDVLTAEKGAIAPDAQQLLRRMGHELSLSGSSRSQGNAMGIFVDPATMLRSGAADPRAADGAAAGY